jgi:hypothetical protein
MFLQLGKRRWHWPFRNFAKGAGVWPFTTYCAENGYPMPPSNGCCVFKN